MNNRHLISGVLCALIAVSSIQAEDAYQGFDRNCGGVENPAQKIRSCREFVKQAGTDDTSLISRAYGEIAQAYYELGNDRLAVQYAEKRRDVLLARNKRHPYACGRVSPQYFESCVRARIAGASGVCKDVGAYEVSWSLKAALANNYELSIQLAKSAIHSFSHSVLIDSRNHSAYASRAELFARFCEESRAEADYDRAIEEAIKQDLPDMAEEYERERSSAFTQCWDKYRGRF